MPILTYAALARLQIVLHFQAYLAVDWPSFASVPPPRGEIPLHAHRQCSFLAGPYAGLKHCQRAWSAASTSLASLRRYPPVLFPVSPQSHRIRNILSRRKHKISSDGFCSRFVGPRIHASLPSTDVHSCEQLFVYDLVRGVLLHFEACVEFVTTGLP